MDINTYIQLATPLLLAPPVYMTYYQIRHGHKPSGLSISATSRQTAVAPATWYFSGWLDEFGRKFNPSIKKPELFENFFEIDGYIQSINFTKNNNCVAHFLITANEQIVDSKAFFSETEEGGFCCTHKAKGYFRQMHLHENTVDADHVIDMLNVALATKKRIKITGNVFLSTFLDKKIDKVGHFLGWDDKVTCPVVAIESIEAAA